MPAPAAAKRLRRAVHFVPGANDKMLDKALGLDADSLVLDLEDAVTPERKEEARGAVSQWLDDVDFDRQERIVRMNPTTSPWGRADVEGIMAGVRPPDAFLVPKVRSGEEVAELDRLISELEERHDHPRGAVALILLGTETPHGVLAIGSLCTSPRVAGLTWGAEDLSAAIGASRNRDESGELLEIFRYCRNMTLIAARAAEVQPLDTVFVDIRNPDGLRRESEAAAAMGYEGKITIHPSQIAIVNEAFTPSADEIATASELFAAFEENRARGRMAFTFRGQMVDVPHLERAERTLDRARAAGLLREGAFLAAGRDGGGRSGGDES